MSTIVICIFLAILLGILVWAGTRFRTKKKVEEPKKETLPSGKDIPKLEELLPMSHHELCKAYSHEDLTWLYVYVLLGRGDVKKLSKNQLKEFSDRLLMASICDCTSQSVADIVAENFKQ